MTTRRLPLLLIPLLALAACGTPPAAPPGGGAPAPQVGVAKPLVQQMPVTRDLTGRIEAIDSVELKPRVSGTITRVLVQDGAEVAAGTVLFEIDRAPYESAVARLEAQLAQADAQLAQADAQAAQADSQLALAITTRDRNRRLAGDNLVSQQALDDSVTRADASQSTLAAAKAAQVAAKAAKAAASAALVNARLDLGYTVITAPIAGRLGRIQTTVGNLVTGGGAAPATTLASLVAVDPVYVAFDLDEATYRRIAPRLAASATGGAKVPVAIALAGEGGFPRSGTVDVVDNRVDSLSGTIRLRSRLANPDRAMTAGAFARVRLEVEAPRQAVLVHEQAVLAQLITRYVLTVDAQGVTAFRPVVLGAAHGALREVERGLGPADTVAVTNLAKVFFPGMPVQPVPVAMDTLAATAAAR